MTAKVSSRVAAVDGNFYIHRVFHTQSEHTKDMAAAISYRLLALICKDALAARATRVLVAFDGPDVFRHKLVDSYKANRKKDDGEVDLIHNKEGLVSEDGPYKYLTEVCAYIAAAGIPVVQFSAYEADDVLASVAANNPDVALLTRDKDAYQVLRTGVIQYDSTFKVKGKPVPRTIRANDVEKIFGVPPEQCVDLQTLTGDGVDNVPRLIRKDVAIRGLKKHFSLKNWLEEDDMLKEKLRPMKHQLNLNRKLVKLVTTLDVDVPAIRWVPEARKWPSAYFALKDFCNPKSKGLF
jgi:DNA polymerase-1